MSQKLRVFTRLTALAAVGAGCLMATACGLINSGGGGGTASASASVTPDPLAGLSASEIAAKGITNLEAASSLTMDGNLVVSGQSYSFKLGIKPGKGCNGSIGMGSKGSFELVLIGKTMYINPDDTFWKTYAGSEADAAIQRVDGRYIKTTAGTLLGGVTEMCDLSQTLDAVKVTGAMTKGNFTSIDGVKVLPLIQGSDGTLWVTDTAKPEVVKISVPKRPDGMTGSDSTSGALTFSPGAPVTLTAPPASKVIDASAVGL